MNCPYRKCYLARMSVKSATTSSIRAGDFYFASHSQCNNVTFCRRGDFRRASAAALLLAPDQMMKTLYPSSILITSDLRVHEPTTSPHPSLFLPPQVWTAPTNPFHQLRAA